MVNSGIIKIDIHGKTKMQARIAISAAIRKCDGSVYRIRVIHGYNRGTELRDMVRSEFAEFPKILRIESGINPGITDLIMREL